MFCEACGWLRGVDLNHRPLGYEPNELPDCSTPRTDNNNPPICRQTWAWAGLMSCRLCKKTEGAGFPFQIEIFAFTKHTVGPSLAPDLYKAAWKCGSHHLLHLSTSSLRR